MHLAFEILDGKIIITPEYPDSFLSEFCSIVKKKVKKPVRFKELYDEEMEERLNHDLS